MKTLLLITLFGLTLPSFAYNEPICDTTEGRVFVSRGHSHFRDFEPASKLIGSGVYELTLLMDNKIPTQMRFDCRSKSVGDVNNNYQAVYPGSCAAQLHQLVCGD